MIFALLCFAAGPSQPADQGVSITLGLLPVIDTLPLIVAAEKGFFAQQGINVKLFSFSSALERDVALQSGKLNAYFGDLLNTLLLMNAGQHLSIVTVVVRTDPRQRMFALLVSPRSGIADMKHLEGESVAISKASVIEYILDRMVARSAVRSDRIGKMEVRSIPLRFQMLMTGQVHAALLPEPLASKAESEGARALADDGTLNETLTVVALRSELVRRFPSLSTRFVAAYGKAVQTIEANPGAYMDLLVERTQFPASLKGRYKVPVFPPPGKPRKQDVLSIEAWLLERGLISKTMPYEAMMAP
ncbi:MAG: MetQ/NlpA family ABC transporter substrate-binding protein [Syntrophorhabdales bacterium]